MNDAAAGFDVLGKSITSLAVVLPRIVAAFMMLPLLTNETIPALVRNSFFVSLGIIVLPLAGGLSNAEIMTSGNGPWFPLLLKEIVLGLGIGFSFGAVFWAISSAGEVIDGKIGTTMASIVDPILGHQTSLTGTFMSQFATWLFMATGAFVVFLDLLLTSYKLWPVTQLLPTFSYSGYLFFLGEFRYIMVVTLMLAAPALILMTIFDLSFGLINRFAPQLNLFSMTMPIKSLIGTFTLILLLATIVQYVIQEIYERRGLINSIIHAFQ